MSQNKTIIALLALIVILIIVFIVKINIVDDNKNILVTANEQNRNIENNTSSLKNETNSNILSTTKDIETRRDELKIERNELEKKIYRDTIKQYIIPLLIGCALWILWIAGVQKISVDLNMPISYRLICIALLIITTIIAGISLYNGNVSNYNLFINIAEISIIISLFGIFYKAGVHISLIILAIISPFIPTIGSMIYFFVFAYGMWLLGDYYDKSTSFKVGLIFLNLIGLPAMAFKWKFIK